MSNTNVHFITGNPNVGKTTTAWLIYLLLKGKGEVVYFHLFNGEDYKYNIPEETEEPACKIAITEDSKPIDFCAIIVVGHVRIHIMSPGDNADAIKSGMKWLGEKQPDVYIGCSRSNFNSYARRELYKYEGLYDIKIHRLYCDYAEMDFEKACESRTSVARQIINTILTNITNK